MFSRLSGCERLTATRATSDSRTCMGSGLGQTSTSCQPAWPLQRVHTPVQVKLRPIVESNAEVLGLNLAAAAEAICSRTAGEAASQELTAAVAEMQCSLGMSARGGAPAVLGSACLGQLSADARRIASSCTRQASGAHLPALDAERLLSSCGNPSACAHCPAQQPPAFPVLFSLQSLIDW